MHSDLQKAKETAGRAAADLVKSGMRLGIGTGSTVYYFIEALGEKLKREGLSIQAVATSARSEAQAKAKGIPLLSIEELSCFDLMIDGADEVDPHKSMVKGAGGALLREKIIANSSERMIVIVDPTKLVKRLGKAPLYLEIVPFGYKATLRHLEYFPCKVDLRRAVDGAPYISENGNYMAKMLFDQDYVLPERLEHELKEIPGIIETGLFVGYADQILIGHPDGTTTAL